MFRSATHSGCHGIFQRGGQASKDETSFHKYSVSSNNSTAPIISSGGQSRSTSISSTTTISSRGSSARYNPLCLHPPMAINEPPKIDDNADFCDVFVLEEEEDDDDYDAYFRSDKYRQFQKHHQDQVAQGKSFIPFHPDACEQFRFPAPGEEQKGRRTFSLDEEAEPPCPDVDWELEQHIPVDGTGWHKKKRDAKRKATLLKAATVHTMGAYI